MIPELSYIVVQVDLEFPENSPARSVLKQQRNEWSLIKKIEKLFW